MTIERKDVKLLPTGEVVITPRGMMRLFAVAAHGETDPVIRDQARRFLDYGVQVAEGRGYAHGDRFREMLNLPDRAALMEEIRVLAGYVNPREILQHFRVTINKLLGV